MTYFSGTVERLIFENPSNYFKILALEIDDTDNEEYDDDHVIVTGTMAEITEGDQYTFHGEMVSHPRYGDQLRVETYEKTKPTLAGLISYLSGPQFKGIGRKTAERIVELYGENAIDKILENPDKLKDIRGLSAVNRESFLKQIKLNYGTEQILSKLAEYGLTSQNAINVVELYKDETLDVIHENPYQLVEDIKGIGFKIADKLAERIGIGSDSPERFRAALLHTVIEQCLEEGNTYIEAKNLLTDAIDLLEDSRHIELDPQAVAKELTHLLEESKLQNIETKIFENTLFYAERGIKKQLTRLLDNPLDEGEDDNIDDVIQEVEEEINIQYDEIQKQAIKEALTNKVFILTGGPGTGKTTVINGIISAYAKLNRIDLRKKDLPILLAAPTGRASRRMNELTGLPSATIHRHLGLTNSDGEGSYSGDDIDYLDADLIIVDEFSMVDTWLANQLLSHIATPSQLIIVGDSDQLPSVGPGQVLADLLQVKAIPQISLERIFRQGDDSTIVTLASEIRQGIVPNDFRQQKGDRSYFEVQAGDVPPTVAKIVQLALKKDIAQEDIQILAPMYRGPAGIDALNQLMQEQLNPLGERLQFQFNQINFRAGDKVIHLINDAESNVFNGDIGYIMDLIPAKYTESKQDELVLNFDGIEINYARNEWSKITLAYAMSIHKSQGSEFPVVILPITRNSSRMLARNLIYTAITRSKSKLILLGEFQAFTWAIQNEGTQRLTYLVQRFQEEDVANEEQEQAPQSNAVPDSVTIQNSPPSHEAESKNPVKETDYPQSQPIIQEDEFFEVEPDYDEKRLTPENYLMIDPMIGITEEDINRFFK